MFLHKKDLNYIQQKINNFGLTVDNNSHIFSFITNQALLAILPIITGMVLFFVATNIWFTKRETKFDEIALGAETQSHFASVDSVPIHCHDVEDASLCIEGWEERGKHPSVLWLGNSQVHAINQMKESDTTGASLLFHILQSSELDLLTFSQPNANFQEHYVLFEYLTKRLKLGTLILPAVFDDTRETGLRDGVEIALQGSEVITALTASSVGRILLEETQAKDGGGDLAGLHETMQEKVESRLTDWLGQHSPIWVARVELRGQLMNLLYRLRNLALGINPQSKRRVIKGRYNKNLDALTALLDSAGQQNIQTLVYIAPLRDDVEVPYVAEEYELFKSEIQRRVEESGAIYINLEHLVPGALWGTKDTTTIGGGTELDFMHFKGGGHKLLSDKLYYLLLQYGMVGKD